MTITVAENTCNKIGEVIRAIGVENEQGGSFIRVRVEIDILLPLCRGRVITLESGEKSWVSFKYERLPNLCYWCGHLNHGDKDCPL